MLPDGLEELCRRWLGLDRARQDELYARELGPMFAPHFASLPLDGARFDPQRPKALISVLGLSWQPVALMAAWCTPDRVLLVGTTESLNKHVGGEHVLSVIARLSGVPEAAFSIEGIGEPLESQVYGVVRKFLRDWNLQGHECWVDPTGGKKSMSAAAALAAYVIGAPLVYVDYREYLNDGRIPLAGTEYPRLLQNPLAVYGDLEIDAVLSNFDGGLFGEAEYIVSRLKERIDDKREASVLQRIIEGYSLWNRFELKGANNKLDGISLEPDVDHPERPYVLAEWRWSKSFGERFHKNRNALDALQGLASATKPSLASSVPLLGFYAASARRLLAGKQQHLSQAVMLAYAMVERYIVLSLQELGACDERVRFIENKCPSIDDCVIVGNALFGTDFEVRPFSGSVMFASGALALSALSPDHLPHYLLALLKDLSGVRNRTEYEHGFIPRVPKVDQAKRLVDGAVGFMFESKCLPDFKEFVDACTFPILTPQRRI